MPHRVSLRQALMTAALSGAALTLTACGGSSGATGATTSSGASSSPTSVGRPAGRGPGPAAVGEIAAKSGRTLQVQNTSSQTAVTYTAKTSFTSEEATTLASVRVGSCIVATSAESGSTSDITATTVHVTPAIDGDCTRVNRRQGGPPTGMPSGMRVGSVVPSGVPMPSGMARNGGMGFVGGKVTAVTGSTITVAMPSFGGSKAGTGTVHVTSATKYTTTVKATSAAAKVGRCVVVQGKADSSGAVTATSIAVTNKTNGSCTTFASGGAGNG